jgi:hypothetical protein
VVSRHAEPDEADDMPLRGITAEDLEQIEAADIAFRIAGRE